MLASIRADLPSIHSMSAAAFSAINITLYAIRHARSDRACPSLMEGCHVMPNLYQNAILLGDTTLYASDNHLRSEHTSSDDEGTVSQTQGTCSFTRTRS